MNRIVGGDIDRDLCSSSEYAPKSASRRPARPWQILVLELLTANLQFLSPTAFKQLFPVRSFSSTI